MNVMIQINDVDYASLLNGSSRIQGSIGLVSPTEGNFNAHRRTRSKPGTQYMRLPHGKVSVSDDNVRMHLCISRDEMVDAPQAILGESIDASNFVEIVTDDNLNFEEA
jgi:hypothetical protein